MKIKELNTLNGHWDELAEIIFNESTPEFQKNEMQRAFYAGAAAILGTMLKIGGDVSDEAGAEILEGLHQEVKGFFNGMRPVPESGAMTI